MNKPAVAARNAYPHFLSISTRWIDNDVYGHVNNVVYYSYFDTVVNEYLIRHGVLDIEHGQTIGLVVETRCNYFSPLVFPDRIDAGLRVARLGTSSVRYEVGLFKEGENMPAAQGHFVHVYVDRATRRPVALPDAWRAALQLLAADGPHLAPEHAPNQVPKPPPDEVPGAAQKPAPNSAPNPNPALNPVPNPGPDAGVNAGR
jgi:acyl-CoA thioester hydrolase